MTYDLLHPNLQVLLAEDNHANSVVIQTLLERAGYHVVTAKNGLQALNLRKLTAYDLVILDIKMPIMCGVSTLKKIQTDMSEGDDILIFALTTHFDLEEKQHYLSIGFDAVLTKPLRNGDLQKALQPFEKHRRYPIQSIDKLGNSNHVQLLDSEKTRAISNQYCLEGLIDLQSRHWSLIQDQCAQIERYLPMALEGDEQSLSDFRRAVHAIKVSSGPIGLLRVEKICQRLRNVPQFEISAMLLNLIEALSESRPALEQALSRPRQLNPSVQMRG